jgi:ORF6N domain
MVDRTETEGSLELIPLPAIQQRILVVRERHVMLDEDLAELYGVQTGRLIQQVKRNIDRFPPDFAGGAFASSVSGGKENKATGEEASISGGGGGEASAPLAPITGGHLGKAPYRASTVLGGLEEVTEKEFEISP